MWSNIASWELKYQKLGNENVLSVSGYFIASYPMITAVQIVDQDLSP